ncbi:MAG: hypothetical protein HEQ39_06805 [Rhizobacter sp.]
MAISLVDRQQAFSHANFHLQLKVLKMPATLRVDYDVIHVVCVVIAVFRSLPPIGVGSVVGFDLPVVKAAAIELPDGGSYCRFEDVLQSGYIEVCLTKEEERLNITADLVEAIGGPSSVPVITFPATASNLFTQRQVGGHLASWQR